jgi:hypothetical protein
VKIRPGRTRSLLGGLAALLVTIVGAVMLSGFARVGGPIGIFLVVWVIFGLIAAAASFYNAFSERGLPLYEIDTEEDEDRVFCPQCGRPVGGDDEYCRHCGAHLSEG